MTLFFISKMVCANKTIATIAVKKYNLSTTNTCKTKHNKIKVSMKKMSN